MSNAYQVFIPDPWAFSREDKTEEPESCHSTFEAAEAHCHRLITAELQRRFDELGSWSEALRAYIDSAKVVWIKGPGDQSVFFSDFAREWVVKKLTEDWPALMDRIGEAKPETPCGWFRWLHHTSLSRMSARVHLGWEQEWRTIEAVVRQEPQRLDALLVLQIEAHAWEIGKLALRQLTESCWNKISAHARGLILSGLSNRQTWSDETETSGWIQDRLPEALLTGERVLELACNAVSESDFSLLQASLEHGRSRLLEMVERIEPLNGGPSLESRFAKHVAKLSHRAVDMVLEACVIKGWSEGAILALQLGASPNLRIWALERNYNEHHSALSYALKEEHNEVAEALLDAGARPEGEMGSKTLCRAISSGNDAVAERLIHAGVSFECGEKPQWLADSRPGDNIEWERAIFF